MYYKESNITKDDYAIISSYIADIYFGIVTPRKTRDHINDYLAYLDCSDYTYKLEYKDYLVGYFAVTKLKDNIADLNAFYVAEPYRQNKTVANFILVALYTITKDFDKVVAESLTDVNTIPSTVWDGKTIHMNRIENFVKKVT